MTKEQAAEVVNRRLQTVRDHIRLENSHDLSAVMGTFGSAARFDDEPWDEHHTGHDAVRSFYEQLLRAVPDLEIEVKKEHVNSETVIIECVIRGTHSGKWRGLPPTGRHVALPLCGIYTFDDDDKLVGERIYYDRATLFRQIGIFREPTSLGARLLLLVNHPINIAKAWVSGSRGSASKK